MASDDPWRTVYRVQPFVLEHGRPVAGEVREASSGIAALRLGERLAAASAGILVYAQRCAPELGEFDPPEILATHGRVPDGMIGGLKGSS